MDDDFELYDSREEIACAEFRGKYIGVYVRNMGNDYEGNKVADITVYNPCLHDIVGGRNFHLEEMDERIIKATRSVIERIDETIAELEKHKQRMEQELQNRRQ